MEEKRSFLRAIGRFFTGLFRAVFGSKKEKMRNKNLFKRGGYAAALVALVLVGAVVLNLLVSLLAKRVNLTFDLTGEKKNSISSENRDYIQKIDKDIQIYILAGSDSEYYGGYMQYYANQRMYTTKNTDYYKQTTKLLAQYAELNDRISVTYVDPYGTEMSKLNTDYPNTYSYGDILVTCQFEGAGGVQFNNSRLLSLTDVYTFTDESGGAAYGYDYYYMSGSCLETSLTSALYSVTSEETKKVGFIAGHGGSEAFSYYRDLLELNNFTVDDISDGLITKIDASYDVVVICAPTSDFLGSEVDALNDYLHNDGHKGKTLLFYGDSGYQNLPNLFSFLDEWGIGVQQGIVFETNDTRHESNAYSTLISASAQTGNKIALSNRAYITGYNLPMSENGRAYGGRETTTLITTMGTTVCAPIGTPTNAAPAADLERQSFATCIQATESDFDNNVPVTSYVIAYSSVDFIAQNYVENYKGYCDFKDLALRTVRVPTGVNDNDITFENKSIEATSDLYLATDAAAKRMFAIFVVVIPIALVVVGLVIFFKRRNL